MHRLTELLGTIGETVRGFAARAMRGLEAARNRGRRRRMRVVESLALGGRRQLLLVICDEQEYLVGTGADSVATIVPRQPAGTGQSGQQQPGPVSAGVAGAKDAQRVFGQVAGGLRVRGGAPLRERTGRGPWLMTPSGSGLAKNRIQEAEQSRGRHLWQ